MPRMPFRLTFHGFYISNVFPSIIFLQSTVLVRLLHHRDTSPIALDWHLWVLSSKCVWFLGFNFTPPYFRFHYEQCKAKQTLLACVCIKVLYCDVLFSKSPLISEVINSRRDPVIWQAAGELYATSSDPAIFTHILAADFIYFIIHGLTFPSCEPSRFCLSHDSRLRYSVKSNCRGECSL